VSPTAKHSPLSKKRNNFAWILIGKELISSRNKVPAENFPHDFFATKTSTANNQDFALPEVGINLNKLEADLIHQALQRTNGNRAKSARLLGLSRDTLLYRIQKHGLANQ
jgi:DNA-binding NtrC family response regulator